MLDAKLLRSDFENIRKRLVKRNIDVDFGRFLEMDKRRRELLTLSEELKSRQNAVSKQIPQMKKEGGDVSGIMSEMKELSDKVKAYGEQLKEIEAGIEEFLLTVPNAPCDMVPPGASDADNLEIRKWGSPPVFEGDAEPHWDIGARLDIIEQTAAARVTGARFTFMKGQGAALERAIISFMLDTHIKNGYVELMPPYIVHKRSMLGTGQLPKFEEDMFKLSGTDYYLIPTAEVPVTNIYREQILDGSELTIKHCAYSACFRAEAGSAGRDTRGLIRQHQFNKVELVKFARPEDSYNELETLTEDAERILRLLGLSYRVVRLCGGDMGFSSAMTYDIEVWMPSYGRYVEISSCSNFEDFQARRAGIRYKDSAGGKPAFVHTLNGSGLAVGRTLAAILENFRQPDGSVAIPEVLRGYMGGIEKIG